MAVTDQLSALRALGTDPVRKLVVPREIAGTLMVPILTMVANGVGLVGAWLITLTQLKVATTTFWNAVVMGLYIQDVWMGIIKPFFLGFVIVTIGCHVGLRTAGGTQGVGRSTTNAVVASSVMVIAVDFFVTRLLFDYFVLQRRVKTLYESDSSRSPCLWFSCRSSSADHVTYELRQRAHVIVPVGVGFDVAIVLGRGQAFGQCFQDGSLNVRIRRVQIIHG